MSLLKDFFSVGGKTEQEIQPKTTPRIARTNVN